MTTPSRTQPLAAPRATETAQESIEILRLWIVNRQELAATFPVELYGDDVWKWGRLLANLARYVANADAQQRGVSQADSLEAIRLNFDQEVRAGGDVLGEIRAAKESG